VGTVVYQLRGLPLVPVFLGTRGKVENGDWPAGHSAVARDSRRSARKGTGPGGLVDEMAGAAAAGTSRANDMLGRSVVPK